MSSDHAEMRSAPREQRTAVEAGMQQHDDLPTASSDAATNGEDEQATTVRFFEDLTISELLALLWRSPVTTMRRLRIVIESTQAREQQIPIPHTAEDTIDERNRAGLVSGPTVPAALRAAPQFLLRTELSRLSIYLAAFIFALIGSSIARGTADISRSDGYSLQVAAPYLWLGFLLWLVGDICGRWTQISAYWQRCDRHTRLLWSARIIPAALMIGSVLRVAQSMSAPRESAVSTALSAVLMLAIGVIALLIISAVFKRSYQGSEPDSSQHVEDSRQPVMLDRTPWHPPLQREISSWRKALVVLASALSLVVWINSSGNRMEPHVMLYWLASVVSWALVFTPPRWNVFDWGAGAVDRVRRLSLRGRRWVIAAAILILILGASFRFDRLDAFPSEMNSDMVVNILDAYKIHRGEDYRIFLSNNGGREPLHVYLMALAARLPGLDFDQTTLNLVSALASFLALPIMLWFAVEVFGKRRRQHAYVVGLLAAALLAASFWHVTLARQGFRIPLSPLLTALSAVFFVRALRHNRRSDFVLAGITLGIGLYSYKAVRMLPLVYVIGVAIALLLRRYSWRMRWKYIVNLAVLAFMASVVFLPTLRFWIEEPGEFTQRATSRIFGDQPTTDEERWALLLDGGATFLQNSRSALLMFHHTHDNTWISAIPGQPALDPVTGAFLILGAAAWLGLMASERDPVFWFVPVLFFVMILLTALAIAFPIEVPSLQRASNAIPAAYLFAALPMAILCRQFYRALPRLLGLAAAIGFVVAAIGAAYHYNRDLYFGEFMDNYHRSAQNHSEAGQILRGFAESDGAYGNAFIITSPHWWDHRAVGVEAGAIRWDNSIVEARRLPQYLRNSWQRSDQYQLQPQRDLLFFFAPRNEEAPLLLRHWFPEGRQLEIRQEPVDKTFFVYRVPAMGEDGLLRFLAANS